MLRLSWWLAVPSSHKGTESVLAPAAKSRDGCKACTLVELGNEEFGQVSEENLAMS